MSRKICVAAAQMGPIARDEPRESTVARMMAMMREAHGRGARLVVFPELALTTFFPRWWMENEAELDTFYEDVMPNAAAAPLFDLGRELEVGFYLGYAEIVRAGNRKRRFNTSILVDRAGRIAGKYRKVHLPGHANHEPDWPFLHLEKAYFEPGDLGFPVFDAFDARAGQHLQSRAASPAAALRAHQRDPGLIRVTRSRSRNEALSPALPGNAHRPSGSLDRCSHDTVASRRYRAGRRFAASVAHVRCLNGIRNST